jgi:Outer membrane protein beta-barrel domain
MQKIKTTLLIAFFLVSLNNYGQFYKNMFSKDPITNLENFDKKRVNYGFILGFNSYDFKFDYKNVGPDIQDATSIGFNVGLVGNLRISERFSLRFEPLLSLNQRDLTFPGFEKRGDAIREVKSTYVHFPLLIKFSSDRIGNIKPFLVGGVSTAINLSSNENIRDDNASGIFRMSKWTNYYELGVGIDLYLQYFKFSPSVRGVFSLNDELIRDADPNSPWTGNVKSMQTRGIFVNFTFQ